ncbi:MAG: FAD-dependent oxidoreductase [Oscillospiraceae bacterium]|jgi:2,4-dienoyl-CoA reductase-like NADH-dependent reductase (Old Yellow Enzyme family)/thioredoxin reductase
MKYKNLLSPVKIGNVVLKNHISSPDSSPHFLQGPETFPADGFRAFMIQMAKSCAYMVLADWCNPLQRVVGMDDSKRMQNFDMSDPSVSNYFQKMCDDIHFYGSKLFITCFPMRLPFPEGYNLDGCSHVMLPGWPEDDRKALPADRFPEVAEAFANWVSEYQVYGYDGVSLNISMLIGCNHNTRTDEFGCTTPQNAARFPGMLFKAVKDRCGQDFLTEAYVYGEMDNIYTTDYMAAVIKELEDVLDIVTIKEKDAAANHPTGFQFTKGYHPCFNYARAVRDTGAKVLIGVNGGFQDPEELDKYLAEGKCDFFAMARGLFCEPDYMQKVMEGRGEDITPCLWCNKCHGFMGPPFSTLCSVNPRFGMDHVLINQLPKPAPKKVAVVGGGPIGMRAAIMAAELGHDVTLYEKTNYLGGQLIYSDHMSFKWPIRDHKSWLIRQLGKKGVKLLMNTEATPDMIKAGGYDAVIAATGAKPNIPAFAAREDGTLKDGLMTIMDVFGNEDRIGKKVIIVGGSESGVETGMHLCELGRDVTVLTRQFEIAHDASHLHSITMAIVTYDPVDKHEIMKCAWEKYPNFKWIVHATTTEVTPKTVTYKDKEGKLHNLEADTVIICGGMNARADEALRFYGCAPKFFMAGDCEKVANLHYGNRSAMGKVYQI